MFIAGKSSVHKSFFIRLETGWIHVFISCILTARPHSLLQVCQKVDVFGFDVAKPKVPIRYHYFDKTEPTELHSTEFEHNLLRLLNAYKLIRLCTVDTVESCINDWEVQRNRIGHRRLQQARRDNGKRDSQTWSVAETAGLFR